MGFLFVDEISHLDPGKCISGIKYVRPDEPYLYRTREGIDALLPVIIGETLGQLGAWCVMCAQDFTHRPVAGIVSSVHVYGDAPVGSTLVLETEIDSLLEDAMQYHATASLEGKPVFTIESAIGPLLPMQMFVSQQEVRSQFAQIYQPECPRALKAPGLRDAYYPHTVFDKISSFEAGVSVVAEKTIDPSAPYFTDHFPLKPVLPMTILLNCKLMLASLFIKRSFPDLYPHFKLLSMQRIKMKEFVSPGALITTRMTVKEQTDLEILLDFQSLVADKCVCRAQALFVRA